VVIDGRTSNWVWGVDPGTRKIACFGIDIESNETMYFAFETKKDSRWKELRAIRHRLSQLHVQSGVVFCEEPVLAGARNIRTTIGIAQTVGVAMSTGLPSYLVEVSTWKKQTVGKGNADKAGVSDWLRQEYEAYFRSCDGNQDIVDAAAIAVYGRDVVLRSPRSVDSGSCSPL
jgi:Holliday junction resolvasome RuvABC endonuclease subunit